MKIPVESVIKMPKAKKKYFRKQCMKILLEIVRTVKEANKIMLINKTKNISVKFSKKVSDTHLNANI